MASMDQVRTTRAFRTKEPINEAVSSPQMLPGAVSSAAAAEEATEAEEELFFTDVEILDKHGINVADIKKLQVLSRIAILVVS